MAFSLQMPSRGEVAMDLKARVKNLLVWITSDELMHAEAVAMGAFAWRQAFTRDMGVLFNGNRIHCDDLANSNFRYLEESWTKKHPDGPTPKEYLNRVEIVAPPTEKEIDESWELEIASDERSLNQNYEGSARTRKGSFLGSRTTKPETVN